MKISHEILTLLVIWYFVTISVLRKECTCTVSYTEYKVRRADSSWKFHHGNDEESSWKLHHDNDLCKMMKKVVGNCTLMMKKVVGNFTMIMTYAK